MPHHHYINEVFVFAPLSDGIVHALKIHEILFFCIQFKDYITTTNESFSANETSKANNN